MYTKMFAVNLKSFVCTNYSKLSKDVCCTIFGSKFLKKYQTDPISKRSLAFILYANKYQSPLIVPKQIKYIPRRNASESKKEDPVKGKGPITWKSLFISFSIGSAFLLFLLYLRSVKRAEREKERKRALGKVQIGGSFDLVNQDNQRTKSEDFIGKWLLLYFGFTHCPDICPDEIEKMVNVVNEIDGRDDMNKVTPVFITVDPARDSPSVVKKYLKEFSDKIIGLTGTTEQVAKACKAYRVYFSAGPKDSDADYIVDHTIIMYLIDPDGAFVDYFGQNKNVQQIVNSIHYNMVKYEKTRGGNLIDKVADALFN